MRLHLTARARIVALILAAAIPLVLLSVYIAMDQRTLAESRARHEITQHTQFMSALVSGMYVSDVHTLDPLELGHGETVVILDDDGNVLLHVPPTQDDPVDKDEAAALLGASVEAREAVIERRDARGVSRLYAFRNSIMQAARPTHVTVVASADLAVVHEDSMRLLMQSLSGIAIVTLALILIAWFGAERLVLQPIRALLAMSARVRSGDFAARTGMEASREELSELGSALDRMAEQLQRRDARLSEALEKLRTLAVTDALTGLYNRRYFWEALKRELIAARRKPSVFSVILVDLDHFKRVNDAYGHDAGDRVLQATANLLRGHIRGSDIAVRYGGEEFALLLPGTGAAVAEERAEQLRRELEALEIACNGGRIRITLSAGVAESGPSATNEREIMKRVDEALYAAKAAGRNRVVMDARRGGSRSEHAGPARRRF
jgi:diguanylate cyclase (GGDEF)-like protein